MFKFKTPVVALLTTLALTACKVQVNVPDGGKVVTETENFSCESGNSCEVSVVDIFFDETFVAVPDDGYTFGQWRKRDRGLCGGSDQPCRLFTAGFAGNAALMAFLERDEVFYLDPIFEQTDLTPVSDDHGSVCVNEALFQNGATVSSQYRFTSPATNTIYNFEDSIEGTAIFNGQNTIRRVIKQSGGDPAVASELTSYFTVHNVYEFRQYGNEAVTAQPSVAEVKNTFDKYKLDRWNIEPGESYSHSYNTATEIAQNGQTITNTSSTSYTTTYLGVEAITIEAGTFQGCKTVTVYNDGDKETHWWAVNHGILLKMVDESDGITQELVTATINGTPL